MTLFSKPRPGVATYEDLFAIPDNMVGEILFGELIAQPRPRPKHAQAVTALSAKIGGPFDYDGGESKPGGWRILMEPELHLGNHIVVPDLAGWRRERMPKLPETAWFETPPDWICEVLSPSARQYDLVPKRAIYAEYGVTHVWFIDPDAKTLEAFELDPRGWALTAALAGDCDCAIPPFDAAPFPLQVLWAD